MRLQRLEINGFKSFPDRSELAFDAGVTAIVGPNGCGKSNVVDAISWVLGEQSAKSLRGDRMEDVIFAGSDARKPTAAAEVRLLFKGVMAPAYGGHNGKNGNGNGNGHALVTGNGGDGVLEGALLASTETAAAVMDEPPQIARDVEVGRRLYRSGESEYLIDGEVCRLRDVQDLLMDSGLGTKAYAVIEQGKIGQILTAKPTDRRQLIEEAAGVTKYKSRRRTAELKLEAAQQNLTRVEDIIFEVDKQRAALKRQAAKARRYRKLREELRRWEKVLFARRYRVLAATIEAARARVDDARHRESLASAHLAGVEGTLERLRLELAEADARATAAREAAHARELEIGRRQQQIALDRQQVEILGAAIAELTGEVAELESRCAPAELELATRRAAAMRADHEREEAARVLAAETEAYAAAQRDIETLEADVEAARSEVFAAVNSATALSHAVDHAAAGRARLAEEVSKLELERAELQREADKAARDRQDAESGLRRAQESLSATRLARSARESELASARIERDWRGREMRSREHDLAAATARLSSLEEMDAARAGYDDGARLVLSDPASRIPHLGSVADHLEADGRFELAVEACFEDLLQHVVVRDAETAAAGLELVRAENAGRCGFLVVKVASGFSRTTGDSGPAKAGLYDGLIPIADVVTIAGPAADAIRAAIGDAWIVDTLEQARAASVTTDAPIATLAGDVCRGPHVVCGGGRSEARGILTVKREIKELRERIAVEQQEASRLGEEIAELDVAIAQAEMHVTALAAEQHREEKQIVGQELQLARAKEEAERVGRKQDLVAVERRRADEEMRALEARQQEAQASIVRLQEEQRSADERFADAQRRLFAAREDLSALGRRAAGAGATHAALVERAAALAAEVGRLEEASTELETRIAGRRAELGRSADRRTALGAAIVDAERQLDDDVRTFDELRAEVKTADESSMELRTAFDAQEVRIRESRHQLEQVRADLAQLDVTRATAEVELTHLAAACVEAVGASLDDVAAEVGSAGPMIFEAAEEEEAESAEEAEFAEGEPARETPGDGRVMSAEDAISELRAKIDRLGPVNMMAIEQFDELETRHTFLTEQRKDLVDAIAATGEAIRRIDKTTRERFTEAFTAINQNFQETFVTLFGGGRAGLVLLDESDMLETGIDIIAQPPGKRLQNVQLLSGGEKALTAMALMFGIFRYRPSPFCLLDEIDAPLDDANIGRFIEMLRGMQDRTQFILITHSRKTMEIADRLYGVTMEEPGVSKLISIQLN